MQTHTDRRSPSQVKVGHREGAGQGKVQVLTRFFHVHFYVETSTLVFHLSGNDTTSTKKPSIHEMEQLRFRRRGLILFVVCLLLIAIPLSLTAYQNIIGIEDNNSATVTVQNWLQGTYYQADTVSVNDRVVSVTIDGTGQIKPLQQLANQLARALRRPILLNLRTVPAQNSESQGP